MVSVISMDQPRCSRCGAKRNATDLNGYDPLAPSGRKYLNAYCLQIAECNSQEAQEQIIDLVATLNETK